MRELSTWRLANFMTMTVAITFALSVTWEFWLEEAICAVLGIRYGNIVEGHDPWHFVGTSTVFAVLSVILPGLLLLRTRATLRRTIAALDASRREAESANRLKSEFLAGMGNELHAPLNAVIGLSALLREDPALANGLSGEFVKGIHRSSTRLMTLIEEIVDMAKWETGALEFRREPVDPVAAVNEAVELVKPRMADKRLGLRCDVPQKLPVIEADRNKLVQVVFHLLSHAAKRTGEAGVVSVSAGHIDGAITIEVTDTGPAMGEDELRDAMRPFAHVAQNQSRHPRGSGLELPLAKALAELHGGRLLIRRVGEETRMIVYLPQRARTPQAHPQAA